MTVQQPDSKNQPQLSIIIPAYNVERFLDKCLQSIHTQTYPNFEVILIVNGATDNTASIAQDWAKRDERIHLIIQEKQPVGAVRNLGLQKAQAQAVMFVDSDDYIEPNAIEFLLKLKEKKNAQISAGRFIQETVEGDPFYTPQQLGNILLSGKKAYKLCLDDKKLRSYSWAKIYDKKLFEKLPYPELNLYEDLQIMHKVYGGATRMACAKHIVYHYVSHPQSLLHLDQYAFEREYAYLDAIYNRYCDVRDAKRLTKRQLALFRIYTIRRLVRTFRFIRYWDKEPNHEKELLNMKRISEVYGKECGFDKLHFLWMWTLRMRILLTIFYWKI